MPSPSLAYKRPQHRKQKKRYEKAKKAKTSKQDEQGRKIRRTLMQQCAGSALVKQRALCAC